MEEFSARTRAANLEAMAREPVDVLVIGGGIVGAWTALTAAMRGHRTALVEKGDFASGTSGKTSQLIHGGLRYLQQFRIGVVRRAARERDVLLRMAPTLVKPLTFLIPVYRGRGPRRWQLRIGLWLYDAVSMGKVLPRRKWLSREEALAREPTLSGDGLIAAAVYADAVTRDSRLVLAVVRKAAKQGALVANYARVTSILREEGKVAGAKVLDEELGVVRTVRARAVVNATGVWANELQGGGQRLPIRPTKGIHILVPHDRIGNHGAVTLPTMDRRVTFVIPRGEVDLVGTTDTEYRGRKDEVEASLADVEYLLRALKGGFPQAHIAPADVVAAYAGLRPLIDTGENRESDISREHRILVDRDGLVSVAGGKLTTGRAIASEIMARLERGWLGKKANGRSGTPRFQLEDSGPPLDASNVSAIVARAVREEMAVHVDDVLVRRTSLFYESPDQGEDLAPVVITGMSAELGWGAERRAAEMERYRGVLERNRRWRSVAADG